MNYPNKKCYCTKLHIKEIPLRKKDWSMHHIYDMNISYTSFAHMQKHEHISVLAEEITEYIKNNLTVKSKIIDCTTGLGGHIEKIRQKDMVVPVLGIDNDPRNLDFAKKRLALYQKITLIQDNFVNIVRIMSEHGFKDADFILLDLGLCSTHVDNGDRGFSFLHEGPLDMRFGNEGITATDIVNTYSENEIADILYQFGDERLSRQIAKIMVDERKKKKITTTSQLADLIKIAYHKKGWKAYMKNPATKTFQALRIAVNNELDVLKKTLHDIISQAKENTHIIIISYHSLEDRIIKNIFRDAQKEGKLERINKKVIIPTQTEIQQNPRARSAKLRIAKISRSHA